MIFNQALKWTLHDDAYLIAQHLENELELLLVIPGYAAHKRYGKVFTAITRQMVVGEIVKGAINQLANALVAEMTINELGQRRKEAIRLGLTIHLIDDFGQLHADFLLELGA